MMQRKNKPPPTKKPIVSSPPSPTSPKKNTTIIQPPQPPQQQQQQQQQQQPNVEVATVLRNKFGTQPFDEHWLNVDCCGLFCVAFTYFLHIYAAYAVCWILVPPWLSYNDEEDGDERKMTVFGMLVCVSFCTIGSMAMISHFRAMTTDPGAVPPDATPLPDPDQQQEEIVGLLEEEQQQQQQQQGTPPPTSMDGGSGSDGVGLGGVGVAMAAGVASAAMPLKARGGGRRNNRGKRVCRRCNAFKPARAHHCSICRRCIIKMDHHCPWVNNCVGIGNHKFFLLFLFYTFLSCTFSLTLVVTRFLQCLHMPRGQHCLDEPSHLLNMIGLVVEGLLFGLFTSCMMIDQWDVVMTNVTNIDRLKGVGAGVVSSAAVGGRGDGINEVFGTGGRERVSGFRSDWLSPFVEVCFPSALEDDIMGFCRPCGSRSSKGVVSSADLEMGRGRRGGRNVEIL